MEIGNRILQLRKQKGITQQQLADYLSVLPQTVSRWESDGGLPDITLLPKIAVFFGVTLDELFGMRDMEQILQLVLRYSVLRDEKSYEDAMNAVDAEEAQARAQGDDAKRKQLMAYRMHLLLQKSRQALKEADAIADQLLSETEDESDPLHLTVRLQKMQFDLHNGNVAKRLKESKRNFEEKPCMENLLIYGHALLGIGQGEQVLALYEDDFVKKVLAEGGENAANAWQMLLEAAELEEDLDFFEQHFAAYEKLIKQLNPAGNCLEIRMLLAKLYAARCMTKEKEEVKQVLLRELEEDETLKKREVFYTRYKETILQI